MGYEHLSDLANPGAKGVPVYAQPPGDSTLIAVLFGERLPDRSEFGVESLPGRRKVGAEIMIRFRRPQDVFERQGIVSVTCDGLVQGDRSLGQPLPAPNPVPRLVAQGLLDEGSTVLKGRRGPLLHLKQMARQFGF